MIKFENFGHLHREYICCERVIAHDVILQTWDPKTWNSTSLCALWCSRIRQLITTCIRVLTCQFNPSCTSKEETPYKDNKPWWDLQSRTDHSPPSSILLENRLYIYHEFLPYHTDLKKSTILCFYGQNLHYLNAAWKWNEIEVCNVPTNRVVKKERYCNKRACI